MQEQAAGSAVSPTEPWMDQGQLVEAGGQVYFLSLNPAALACHLGRAEPGGQPGQIQVRQPKTLWGCDPGLFRWHPFAVVLWALDTLAQAGCPLT